MQSETIQTLLAVTGVISAVSLPFVAYLLHQTYKAVAKVGNFPVTSTMLSQLDALAQHVVNYAEEQARKWIKGLEAKGLAPEEIEAQRLTGEQKKDIAIKAMKSLAPPGLKFTNEQATIAIEANVQRARQSIPPLSIPTTGSGTTYHSLNPASPSPTPGASLGELHAQVERGSP